MTDDIYNPLVYATRHVFRPDAHYMVTAGTHDKRQFFDTAEKRTLLLKTLIHEGEELGWQFEAWAILPNHYHFVAQAPYDASTLKTFIQTTHTKTTGALNQLLDSPEPKIWHQILSTCVADAEAHRARLKFVHENPVYHGIIDDASQYPWCSMRWFLETAEPKDRDQILQANPDTKNIADYW